MKTIVATVAVGIGLASLGTGCAQPDASKFRDPIPQQGEASLAVAGSQAAGATSTKAAAVHLDGLGSGGTAYASLYEFTRKITDDIDTGTFAIVAAVAAVTSYPPSHVDNDKAVWGPGGDSLDPVNWRVTVTQIAQGEFNYEVDGRPHGSSSDADFQAIVTGHGYGRGHDKFHSGDFQFNGDVLAGLDPTQSTGGTVKVTYDARTFPRTVTADMTTSDGTKQWYDATVSHGADGSGVLILTAFADTSTPKNGTNENVDEKSRWDATGAGRADVKMSGGDYGTQTVNVSQCWGSTFAQVYYTDSVNYQPTSGSESSCAFAQASFNQ